MNQPGDSYEYDNGAAPTCAVEGGVSAPVPLEGIRGKLTCKAPLAPYTVQDRRPGRLVVRTRRSGRPQDLP